MPGEDLREKVLSWLAEEFEVSTEQPPTAAPLDWVLKVSTRGPLKITMVAQKPRGREALVFTLGLALHPRHREMLGGLPERERVEFSSELLKTLYTMCPDCVIAAQPSIPQLNAILVTKILYLEEAGRAEVLKAARTLANMAVVAMIHFNSRFGAAQQPGGEGFM